VRWVRARRICFAKEGTAAAFVRGPGEPPEGEGADRPGDRAERATGTARVDAVADASLFQGAFLGGGCGRAALREKSAHR